MSGPLAFLGLLGGAALVLGVLAIALAEQWALLTTGKAAVRSEASSDASLRARLDTGLGRQGRSSVYHHDYWDSGRGWLWMSLTMAFWIVLIGAAIYVAIRLANRPPSNTNH